MNARLSEEPAVPALRPLLPFLLLLFFGSGCAALVYEIVWFQMLQLVIGSTAVSLGVLVGTYMGGMCLGSVVLPRLISASRHPLRVYALLEFGIGVLGILILFGMPVAAQIYSAHTGSGMAGILQRGLFAAICLLPPTILMGATLPAMARRIKSTPHGVSWLGFFYGGNIAGAVFGCLLAGFYLLRVHDSEFATFVAAAINGTVALAAMALSISRRFEIREETEIKSATAGKISDALSVDKIFPWQVYVTIALSGLTAIGAEVVWTRLLSLTLGGTVYAFSIILAVFLFGLGIGSTAGASLARKSLRPGILLGWCQFFLTAAIFWTAYMLAESLPYWPIDPSLTANAWFNFQLDMARCLWALLPATILWGASFPLALAAAARGTGSGAARRRNLCGEHGRRNYWRHRLQHRFHSVDWHATLPAIVDRVCGGIGNLDVHRLFHRHFPTDFFDSARIVLRDAGTSRSKNSGRTGRLRTLYAEPAWRIGNALRRRGHEQFRGGVEGLFLRRPQFPHQRQDRGVERTAGHEVAADARAHSCAGAFAIRVRC